MKTPAGKECKYYYEDFRRGSSLQECRLIGQNRESAPWRPDLCQSCPVPDILRANQANTLKLEATVVKTWFGFKQHVQVTGWCSNCFSEVANPLKGCPNCTPQRPSIFDLPEKPDGG
jgi:hypothetical protein